MGSFSDALAQRVMRGFPGWVTAVLAIATVAVVFAQVAIVYIHGLVIGTLAIVEDCDNESSQRPGLEPADPYTDADTASLPPYRDDPEDEEDEATVPPPDPADDAGEDPPHRTDAELDASRRPLTSSSAQTLAHLRRIGGRFARFRGFGVLVLANCAVSTLGINIGSVLGGSTAAVCLSNVAVQLAFASVNMLWTHVVISHPSQERLWRRAIFTRKLRGILLPTLLWSAAQAVIMLALEAVAVALVHAGSDHNEGGQNQQFSTREVLVALVKLLTFIGTAAVLMVLLQLPASIVLVRCQAAMLSEKEVPIVRFDRSFGGRIQPGATLSVRQAWQSFGRKALRRLGRVYLRTAGMVVLVWSAYLASVALVILYSPSKM